MGTEIERKFLVKNGGWWKHSWKIDSYDVEQVYLVSQADISVRVRCTSNISTNGYSNPKTQLGIKIGSGPIRTEYEFDFNIHQYNILRNLYPLIHKVRYVIGDKISTNPKWEIDVFCGDHTGLVLAEIEVENLNEELTLPDWIGEEVTYNPDFYNCNLAKSKRILTYCTPTVNEDVQKVWNEFWKDIILNEDGTINLDKVMCELSDFKTLIDNVPKVYDHVTGGEASNPMIYANIINQLNEKYTQELFQCYKDDMLEVIKECDDPKEIIQIIKNF